MKKRNLLFTALAGLMLFNVCNVNATDPTKDTCKDGVVYTNYYFFSDMNVYEGSFYNKDYRTEGNYSAYLLGGISSDSLAKTMDNADGADDKLLFKKGQIQIVGNNETASGIGQMKLSDFWTFATTKTDQTDGNNYYAVSHSWSKVDETEYVNLPSVDIFRMYNANQLNNASIKLNGSGTVSFVNKTGGNMVFRVLREYSKGATAYNSALTPIEYQNKQWALQPLAYYIQYCVAKDGVTNDVVKPTTTTKKANLPENPKTGVATDVVAFTLVATAAVAGLLVARKKGLFRQL